jgi:hypothetical protein
MVWLRTRHTDGENSMAEAEYMKPYDTKTSRYGEATETNPCLAET